MSRVIRKSKAQSASEALDLLAALFSAELLSPSKCLWLVSPWISDVELVDNSSGLFPSLTRFGLRRVRLAEILVALAGERTEIVVGTTTNVSNDGFIERLTLLSQDHRVAPRVTIVKDRTEELHTKALTGDDYALVGSMNITHRGINFREEFIELRTDREFVGQARMDSFDRFGGLL